MKAPDIIYTDGKYTCAPVPVFSNIDGNVKYIRADLAELTWEDIASIVILADTILDRNEKEWGKRGEQAYYEAVLKAFNDKKNERR